MRNIMLNITSPREYFDTRSSIELDDLTNYLEILRDELEKPAEERFEYDRTLGLLPKPYREYVSELFEENKINQWIDDDDIIFDLIFIYIQTHTYHTKNDQYLLPREQRYRGSVDKNLVKIIERFRSDFEERPMFRYLSSIIYSASNEKDELEMALEAAYSAAKEISFQPNVYTNLSNILINFNLRYTYDVDSEDLPGEEDEIRRIIVDGLRSAINIVSHPLYRSDLAQSLSHLHEYEEALGLTTEALDEAIEQENSDLIDHFSEVRNTILQEKEYYQLSDKADKIQKRLDKLDSDTEDVKDQIQGALQQTFQFISFFAAILAVVLTSVQIAASVPSLQTATLLILTLIGGLMVAFSGFSLLFRDHFDRGYVFRLIIVVIVGIVIVLGGLSFSGLI